MGMCKPSGGIKIIYGPYRGNIKERYGTPNSRTDYYDEQTGELLQQRWYGPDGRAEWDRDWSHSDSNGTHTFPHDHYWNWEGEQSSRFEYNGPDGDKINYDYY